MVRHITIFGEGTAMNTRYLTLFFTALALFLVFRFMLPLILPFVLAYFFAKSLSPVIRFLTEKLCWHRRFSSIILVFLTVTVLTGFLFFIGSTVIRQTILLLQKIPVYGQMLDQSLNSLCGRCDKIMEFVDGTSYHYMENQISKLYADIGNHILPRISNCAVLIFRQMAKLASEIFIFFLSAMLILLDDAFPALHRKLRPFVIRLRSAGLAYMKAQCIIIFLIAVILSVGLYLMKNEYALLFGIGIAVFDAFPIMGSGIILVPWAIAKVFCGDFYGAAILATLFAITTCVREIIEPRIFGKELGMKPLYVLISVYVGIKLFGFGGILLGPIALTVLKVVDDLTKKAASGA